MKKILLLLFAVLLMRQAALAQNTWTANTDFFWDEPSNWSAGHVPTASEDVIIPAGPEAPYIFLDGAVAKTVEVQSGADLIIGGSLTVNGWKIIGSFTVAFYNAGGVHNSGQIVIGNVSNVGSYGLYNTGTFDNNAGGQIRIDSSKNTALYNQDGTFTNDASLIIGGAESVGFVGIENHAAFNNKTGGQIRIDSSTNTGLRNSSGTFTNSGIITIGAEASTGFYGLVNQATFNNPAGQISIDRSRDDGLFNAGGTFTNQATITIGAVASAGSRGLRNGDIFNNMGGQISIDRSTNAYVYNQSGTFTNAAILTLGAVAGGGYYGLFSGGTFNNNTGGQITIDRSTGIGLHNYTGGTFINAASITIGAAGTVGNDGLLNNATFINDNCSALVRLLSDNIIDGGSGFSNAGTVIENSSGNSNIGTNTGLVQNLAGGSFAITNNPGVLTTSAGIIWKGCTSNDWNTATNWSTDQVPTAPDDVVIFGATNQPVISTMGAVAKTVEVQSGATLTVNSAGSLAVNGSKNITDVGSLCFYNSGTVNNNGQLLIGNLSAAGDTGLVNFANFNNNTGGQISIDNTSQYGMLNGNASATILGNFTNAGKITIGGGASVGYGGIVNKATFINNPGGEIAIDHSSIMGLFNESGSFTNAATIDIGTATSVGMYGIVNHSIINNTGGHISIERANSFGLENLGLSTFNNAAILTIGRTSSPIPQIALYNSGTFDNNGCATFFLFSKVFNLGSVTNEGLFAVNYPNLLHSNTGFINNGILVYPQGNPIPNVTNQAIVVTPISGCNPIVTAVQVAANNPFNIGSTWYKDQALTQAAGTFTMANNTFTATTSNIGSTVYFTASNGNTCAYTVPVAITLKPLPQLTSTLSPAAICNKATFSYAPTADLTGTSFTWSRSAVSGISNAAANGTGSISEVLTNTTTASVQVTYAYSLNNTNGCSSASPYNVVVAVKPPATISCPANITANPTSLNGAVVNYTTPGGTDNCTGATATRTAGLASGATFPIGTTTVTHKVGVAPNSASCSFTVTVRNPYSDSKNQKVYVCHKGTTLSINKNDVQDHLRHGDKLGRCDWYTAKISSIAGRSTEQSISTEESNEENTDIKLYPNPTRGQFTIELHLTNNINTIAKIEFINVMGQNVAVDHAKFNNGTLLKNMSVSSLTPGIYITRITVNDKTYQARLVYEK